MDFVRRGFFGEGPDGVVFRLGVESSRAGSESSSDGWSDGDVAVGVGVGAMEGIATLRCSDEGNCAGMDWRIRLMPAVVSGGGGGFVGGRNDAVRADA